MPALEVFHDGQCPVCRIEVAFYRRLDHAGQILWTDIESLAEGDLPPDKTRDDLLGRFHVRELPAVSTARWHVGVDAFASIWRQLPVLHRFAFLFQVPLVRIAAQWAYLRFVRWQARQRETRHKTPLTRP